MPSSNLLMATATATATNAVLEKSGKPLTPAELTKHITRFLDLTERLSRPLIAAHWSEQDLLLLAAGVDKNGKALPSQGYVALRRLGWTCSMPTGLIVSDRVRRMAEEVAARTLRLAVHRMQLVRGLLATWPANCARRTPVEWQSLRAVLPQTTSAEIRNRSRQIEEFRLKHGRLPRDLVELEPEVKLGRALLLAAVDKQQCTLRRIDANTAELRLLAPRVQRPKQRTDWRWLRITIPLPTTVLETDTLHVPTLRVVNGRVRVDLPFSHAVAPASRTGHVRAVGGDWGANVPTVSALVDLTTGRTGRPRLLSRGAPAHFAAAAVIAQQHRRRKEREALATRLVAYAQVLAGTLAPAARANLEQKQMLLELEHTRLCDKIRHANHALGWAVGRWQVDLAQAAHATVVYLEDLATLEAGGRGKRVNALVSGAVRTTIAQATRHLAKRAGIAVVTVPAHNSSKICPRCSKPLHHTPAPDRLLENGYAWAFCHSCGYSADRNDAAATVIAARGLTSQKATLRATTAERHLVIRAGGSHDASVSPARPTKRSSTTCSLPALRRRRVPTSVRAALQGVRPAQRPVGRSPYGGTLRAGVDPQTVSCTPVRVRAVRDYRPVFGFHRNVRVSAIRHWPAPRGHAKDRGLSTFG